MALHKQSRNWFSFSNLSSQISKMLFSKSVNSSVNAVLLVGVNVKRPEARAVLQEIFDESQESVIHWRVSLDSKKSHVVEGSDGFEIKAKCDLDEHSRSLIKTILDRHQLGMKDENGFVHTYSKL